MGHRCKARDHFPSESALPRSLDNRKEQVQKILSLAEIRIGGGREWDIAVNNDGFIPEFCGTDHWAWASPMWMAGGIARAGSAFFENPQRQAGPKRALGLAAGPAMGGIRWIASREFCCNSRCMRSTRPSSAGKWGMVLLVIAGQSNCAPVSAPVSHLPARLQLDATRLAREVFGNEVQAQIHDQSLWCYRQLKEDAAKEKLFAVCETNDGEIDRLLEVNGQELNPEQRQAEDQRIQKMLDDPDQMRQQRKKSEEDAKLERDLLKMFPDACRFQYVGMQGNLIKLKFTPNPNFRPSTRVTQVFHHMEGSLLVDGEQKRLAEIEGQLTSPVKFGWGLLGHLDIGGTFHVKQQDIGSGHWELTMLDVEMSGKELLFKTIGVREKEIDTDFRQVPEGISPHQAFELLRQERPLGMCAEADCSKAQGTR
jgi:hypothetical protein